MDSLNADAKKLPGMAGQLFLAATMRYFLTSLKYFATVRTNGRAWGGVATCPFRICEPG
jgi:hypothetical protein